ncbi:MAG TPA: hypothetical protein VHW74_04080 [Mycobacteriales bacterium]|jgi:hypothetical protein|nr:hypothetical protein [Mycobacteriales bacterium]
MAGVIVVVALAIAALSAWAGAQIADARDRTELVWGAISFLIGPVGLLIAYLMPPVYGGSCPRCAEPFRLQATMCPACHATLVR